MKLSSHVLVCALAATTAVAVPAHHELRNLANVGDLKGTFGDMNHLVTNKEDVSDLKSKGEQAISALLAGNIDNYYSYVGDAASILDKYMSDPQVASFASQIMPLFKTPMYNAEMDKANQSYLSRLQDPAVQQNFASVMQVVNEAASRQAEYMKSEYGVDIYSMIVARLPTDKLNLGDNELVPPTPTGKSSTTSKPTSTTGVSSSSDSSSKLDTASKSSTSSGSDSESDSDSLSGSDSESSSDSGSDTKSNGAGSKVMAPMSMLSLGAVFGALVAFF
ncbi:hypothetical protein H4S02_002577 [Coemansia sp. RSA 2611]|nr:hypothetical protein H4S02_002577 [Coemansia sp. RSA 2611]